MQLASGERQAAPGYLTAIGGRGCKLGCEHGGRNTQIAWRRADQIESMPIPAGYERVYPEFIQDGANFA